MADWLDPHYGTSSIRSGRRRRPGQRKKENKSFKRQATSLTQLKDIRYYGIMSSRTLKPIFQRGGSRRQEILDQAVEMLASRRGGTQGDKMHFCMTNLGMDDTEYLECLNKASNGGLVKSALGWN